MAASKRSFSEAPTSRSAEPVARRGARPEPSRYSATRRFPMASLAACAWMAFGGALAFGEDESARQAAREIFELSKTPGGVIVHFGCGDGRLTEALCRGESCVVQGLSPDAGQVAEIRTRLRSRDLPGSVTVRHWREAYLPYGDNTVNLFVAERPDAPPMTEVQRVLAPRGVACIRNRDGAWERQVKPWPKGMDQWTHWLHAADGNPVGRDQLVGPPRSLQWIGPPRWPKSHDVSPTLTGLVTAQGRLYYIADTGPSAIGTRSYDLEQWHLCARDAFNGVILWTRPVRDWGNRAWMGEGWARDGSSHAGHGPWISNPRVIHKRLVADGNDVYATLGFRAPVCRLDGATGEVLRTYEGTAFTSEIAVEDGVLFATVDRAAQRAGDYGQRPAKSVVAIDPDSGRTRWERKGFHGIVDGKFRAKDAMLTRLSLTVGDGKVFVHDQDAIVALGAEDGAESWRVAVERAAPPAARPFGATDLVSDLLVSDGVLYSYRQRTNRGLPYAIDLQALSCEDGSTLWQKKCGAAGFRTMVSIYKARGLLWVLAPPQQGARTPRSYPLWGLDPRSGEVEKTYDITPVMTSLHHHRCYRNKATENFIIFSRNGLEFTDLRSGKIDINRWVRGICSYGVMPANGLLYTPPQQCICFANTRMPGFVAYGARATGAARPVSDDERLERGSGAGSQAASPDGRSPSWPAYRHDALRSAATDVKPAAALAQDWVADLEEPITATTVGWGKVFLAGLRHHRVMALDCRSGETVWSVNVDNLVDTPPTLWQGKVYFGTAGGFVYCLRADDGELVWRFNANPAHRSIVSFGNIESAWPVHGSVMVADGAVYVAAGRTTYLDGGLRFYALDAETGRVRHAERRCTAGEGSDQAGAEVRGTLNDLFVYDGTSLFMKNLKLDPKTFRFEPATWPYTPWTPQLWQKDFKESPLVSITGFLDDSLYDRSSYVLDQTNSARLLAFNEKVFVGVRWAADNMVPGRLLYHEGFFELGRNHYTVFANDRSAKPKPLGKRAQEATGEIWATRVPVRVEAMTLAGDAVLVAGPPMSLNGGSTPDFVARSIRGEEGGVLMRLDLENGAAAEVCRLPARPVWDGIAVTEGGVFVALRDGKVQKFGARTDGGKSVASGTAEK